MMSMEAREMVKTAEAAIDTLGELDPEAFVEQDRRHLERRLLTLGRKTIGLSTAMKYREVSRNGVTEYVPR